MPCRDRPNQIACGSTNCPTKVVACYRCRKACRIDQQISPFGSVRGFLQCGRQRCLWFNFSKASNLASDSFGEAVLCLIKSLDRSTQFAVDRLPTFTQRCQQVGCIQVIACGNIDDCSVNGLKVS